MDEEAEALTIAGSGGPNYGSRVGCPSTPARNPPDSIPTMKAYETYQGQMAGGAPPAGYQGSPPPPPGVAGDPGAPAGSYLGSPLSPGAHIGPYPPGVQPALSSPPGVESPTYTGPLGPDLGDDTNMPEPVPTAPPLGNMDSIAGYGDVTFDAAFLPPPSYNEIIGQAPPERREFRNVPSITEEEAREALLEFVGEHCCYGKSAARDLTFLDLKSTSAFHYTLETFGEHRSTAWAYAPYKGQPLDSPMHGPAPGPWDVVVPYPEKFKNSVSKAEVPHTASVKLCHDCVGSGRVRCFRCVGRGRVICQTCSGTGRVTESDFHHGEDEDHHQHHHHRHHNSHHKPCTWCNGTGRRRCHTCHGHGQTECKTCDALGNLKCFIQLTVTWSNHFEDHIVERTELPEQLIRGVSGQIAFEEEVARVWPITHFPDPTINAASKRLVERHSGAFPTERILLQRQRVRIVPVTEALYRWKNDNGSFYVYGFEHKVHAPKYPQKCCCGCTIV